MELSKDLAEQGNRDFQLGLGCFLAEGRLVPEDHKAAVYWFRKAADQGSAAAQYNLGMEYEKGLGVAEDLHEALRWYRSSAAKGYDAAYEAIKRCEFEIRYRAHNERIKSKKKDETFEEMQIRVKDEEAKERLKKFIEEARREYDRDSWMF